MPDPQQPVVVLSHDLGRVAQAAPDGRLMSTLSSVGILARLPHNQQCRLLLRTLSLASQPRISISRSALVAHSGLEREQSAASDPT